jgi:hypothetical protein
MKNLKLLILAIGLTFIVAAMITGITRTRTQNLEKMHVEILSLSTSKQ